MPAPRLPDPRNLRVTAASLLAALALLAIFIAAAPGPFGIDDVVHRWSVGHRSPALTVLARTATLTGSGPFVYPATTVVAAWLWVIKAYARAATLAGSVVVGAALCGALKVAVARPRPPIRDMMGTAEAGMSFPSGHTTTGALLFVGAVLALTVESSRLTRRCALAAAVGWAAAIGWSRIYLGFHWVSDVAASTLLAASILLATRPAHAAAILISDRPGPRAGDPEITAGPDGPLRSPDDRHSSLEHLDRRARRRA